MNRTVIIVGLLVLTVSVVGVERVAAESRQIPSKAAPENAPVATSPEKPEKSAAGAEKAQPAPSPGAGPAREVPPDPSQSSHKKNDKPGEKEADTGY
jgi:hypothetical protein